MGLFSCRSLVVVALRRAISNVTIVSIVLTLCLAPLPANAAGDAGLSVNQLRQLAQLAEYVGVDYSAAVVDGAIVSEAEYQEMLEFSGILVEKTRRAGDSADDTSLQGNALALQSAIRDKADFATVSQLGATLREQLLAQMPSLALPGQLLGADIIEPLYQENCAVCHGASGMGDGPMASGLEPAPTNFHDRERADNRSLLGLFDAISNGISDTAMPSFSQLTDQQRWSLAFYAGGMAYAGARADDAAANELSLQEFIYSSPAQLRAKLPAAQGDAIAGLRADPAPLFDDDNPLAFSRSRILAAIDAYHAGAYARASDLAVSAYLDGYELVENSLDAHDPQLRKSIEADMMSLRKLLLQPQMSEQLDATLARTLEQLDRAAALLSGGNLSDATLFSASLIILLREGLEALLVVIALTTVLIKTERKDALKYVHFGWVTALAAGGLTWVAAQSLITISGASREVMEGVAALVAAVVLFYVGIWMHSKTLAANWQAYIQRSISTHLKAGTLWGLAGLSFIAVYREVFETVLFYQALLTQAASSQAGDVAMGLLAGVAILAAITWLLVRYSLRLPIGTFFGVTTYLLLALSFVLMGKAIAALQEASLIDISPLPINFDFTWIGMKSTWQGILAQVAVLVLFLVFIFRSKRNDGARSA